MGNYGLSKLEGENAIREVGGYYYIIRTSWVYSNIGLNFYSTIKNLCQKKDDLRVVADQYGTPTTNKFIALQIKHLIPKLTKNKSGIYHLVPEDFCTWYDFARSIIKKNNPAFDLNRLFQIKTKDYPTKAQRPMNSRLFNEKIKQTFMLEFDSWQSELDRIIDEA